MLLLDDAARERDPDPPPAGLTRDTGFEELALHLRRHAGTVVFHAHPSVSIHAFDLDRSEDTTPEPPPLAPPPSSASLVTRSPGVGMGGPPPRPPRRDRRLSRSPVRIHPRF